MAVCFSSLSNHLKSDFTFEKNSPIESIDAIYLINLDERPEKLEKCKNQLRPFNLAPYRFSAICGWNLNPAIFNDIGVTFGPKMTHSEWVRCFPLENEGLPEYEFLTEQAYGKTTFFKTITPGALGCTLSHLSVLEQAYKAGFETIWVMEDDILVKLNPQILGELIPKLDKTVGKKGWDILYTDTDQIDAPFYGPNVDLEKDLEADLWFFFRPDMDVSDTKPFKKRTILNEDFVQIGSRMRTHSMIIRRSGMKKILDFAKKQKVFLPYDHELAVIPNLKLINLRYDVVTAEGVISDTHHDTLSKKTAWEKYKKETLPVLNQISGWREPEKAEKIMDFILDKKPEVCAEIGSFGGTMTYPIARALKYLKKGLVYGIDSWDPEVATKGLTDEKSITFWQGINFEGIFQALQNLLAKTQTDAFCHLIPKTSNMALSHFDDQSLDFLFLNSIDLPNGNLEDVKLFLPKVKEGGYIWLNQADTQNKKEAIGFLMKHCEWKKEESIGISCILFQKKGEGAHLKGQKRGVRTVF